MVDYDRYSRYVATVCESKDMTRFKAHPDYRYMLEHVRPEHGSGYLRYIQERSKITSDELKEFCVLNDSLGSPVTTDYKIIHTSPTNFRYIFQSHLILAHAQSLNLSSLDMIELGGGYGGLCLALHHFADKYNIKIKSYTIVDLTSPSALQRMYLSKLAPSLQIEYVDASSFGAEIQKTGAFLVSNYCFSEIPDSVQKNYIQHLMPKVAHGFMAWNHIPTYNFGFTIKEEDEYPNTGGKFNKYVYF